MTYINRKTNPVLRIIYFVLRAISWLGMRLYYRNIDVRGLENLQFDGPAIVIANHPSTLMDPLNVGIRIRQEMFFLANYSLFKNPISNWVLSNFYCISIKRKEDVAEGAERNNDDAFAKCYEHFEKKGVLFIAPEGTSWMDRKFRSFKTGTARIAFGAEARNDWSLDIKILPVGLTYNNANIFRSNAHIHYGNIIHVKDWKQRYSEDQEACIDAFTQFLENAVSNLRIHVPDEAADQKLAAIEKNTLRHDPLPIAAHYDRMQHIAKHLDDYAVPETIQPAKWTTLDFLLAPLGIIGFLFWFVPFYIPWLVAKKLNLYIGYDSNVKFLIGIFTLGGWIKLLFAVLGWYFPDAYWTSWAILLFLIVCGYAFDKVFWKD